MSSRARPVTPSWVRPAAYAALVELITVAGTLIGPAQRPYARGLDALAVVLVVVAAGSVAFARALPIPSFVIALATTGAYYGLGYHTDSPYFLGLVVTGYLSAEAGYRVRAGAFGAVTLVTFGLLGVFGRSLDRNDGLATAAIVIAGLVAGYVAAELRAAFNRREQQARDEETLRQVADERLRIARELHDVVSHSIAMINVQASTALHVISDRPEQAREALNNIKGASHDALRDMRGILGLLRDSDGKEPRAPNGGVASLPSLVDNVRRSGTDVDLTIERDVSPLPPSIDLAAYRVVQEALTNVVRHAPGAPARVSLRQTPSGIEVLVENDGAIEAVGPESRHGAGQGLAGMRERVLAVGGTLEAGPRSGGGFSVRAVLPLKPTRE